jgi:hypothetical protein
VYRARPELAAPDVHHPLVVDDVSLALDHVEDADEEREEVPARMYLHTEPALLVGVLAGRVIGLGAPPGRAVAVEREKGRNVRRSLRPRYPCERKKPNLVEDPVRLRVQLLSRLVVTMHLCACIHPPDQPIDAGDQPMALQAAPQARAGAPLRWSRIECRIAVIRVGATVGHDGEEPNLAEVR